MDWSDFLKEAGWVEHSWAGCETGVWDPEGHRDNNPICPQGSSKIIYMVSSLDVDFACWLGKPVSVGKATNPNHLCAGSQCEESRPWQGHEEGSWHTQGVLRLQGPLWKFLSMYPNKNLPGFVLCFSTLLTFSGKSRFRALVFCIWKSVSIQIPLWWLSSLPAGLSCTCDCLRPPDWRRHRKLKTS